MLSSSIHMPLKTRELLDALSSKTRVYMAGPIAKNDWRHKLVPGLRDAFSNDPTRALTDNTLELPTIAKGFTYVGPYFVSCDHGCAHAPGQHGALDACMIDKGSVSLEETRALVHKANMARIHRADAVFAYIDRDGAYGSVSEIQHALDLQKPVFVAFPPDAPLKDDMWFVLEGVKRSLGIIDDMPPKAAFKAFCQKHALYLLRGVP